MESKKKFLTSGVVFAFLSTLVFAFSTPANKLMLNSGFITETMMAAFLYLGSGVGMALMMLFRNKKKAALEKKPGKRDIPWIIFMIVLDSVASVLTIWGLSLSDASTASLLSNFEIFITTIIAALFFKEKISPRLLFGIVLVFLASMVLSVEDFSSFRLSSGSIVVLLGSFCWGLENNVTRRLSGLDSMLISAIKGVGSGITSLAIALILGERIHTPWMVPIVMAIGFLTYGLSFFFYLYAQRSLGASRTAAIFSLAPFLGSFLCFFVFLYLPSRYYIVAVSIMGMGVYLASTKSKDGETPSTQEKGEN